ISACVSPPHDSVSHIVQVAAIIAAAASTALPPRSKIIAPAVAASGFPVTAIQCAPCSGGFCVRWAKAGRATSKTSAILRIMAAHCNSNGCSNGHSHAPPLFWLCVGPPPPAAGRRGRRPYISERQKEEDHVSQSRTPQRSSRPRDRRQRRDAARRPRSHRVRNSVCTKLSLHPGL